MQTMMNKLILAAGLLLGWLGAGAQSNPIPKWKLADLEAAMARPDRPTVINFWATFCKPCIAEIPHFQELVKRYDSAGIRLLLVSLDLTETYPKLPAFAKKRGFSAPILFLDETNADLFCPPVDPKWSGAIPATLFLNPATGYRAFYEESLSRERFQEELRKLVAPKQP
ncbi:MAG: TlpA family protein disulfide reductase [Chitinophagaceae bacterium]|nr:MAG: TlpA family protein disulfide reductase [Chitinophagaceae bacterium]